MLLDKLPTVMHHSFSIRNMWSAPAYTFAIATNIYYFNIYYFKSFNI